jgi:hypothetical protein
MIIETSRAGDDTRWSDGAPKPVHPGRRVEAARSSGPGRDGTHRVFLSSSAILDVVFIPASTK